MALASSNSAWIVRRLRDFSRPLVLRSALAGGLGGLIGCLLGEFINWSNGHERLIIVYAIDFIYFFIVSGAIGAVLGALSGILNRSRYQAIRGARIGALIGGIGGGLGSWPAQAMFNTLGDGLFARAVGWAIVGAIVGLCPGVAARDRKRALRGLTGGFVGGFVGGFLFDLVGYLLDADGGTISRLVADTAVGICVGFMVALVEALLKNAWLTVINGRREGAQFILSKDTTLIGRDDRDDVLLWGDPLMTTSHARLHRAQDGFVLENLSQEAPTLVNQKVVASTVQLRDGDEVILGSTRLLFSTHGRPAEQPGIALSRGRQSPAMLEASPRATTLPHVSSADICSQPAMLAGNSRPDRAYRLVSICERVNFRLPQCDLLVIGRAISNDIVFDDPTVSTRHAELRWDQGKWIVHDLNSTNGTFVSYRGVPQEEQRVEYNALQSGSLVRFGQVTCRLEADHLT